MLRYVALLSVLVFFMPRYSLAQETTLSPNHVGVARAPGVVSGREAPFIGHPEFAGSLRSLSVSIGSPESRDLVSGLVLEVQAPLPFPIDSPKHRQGSPAHRYPAHVRGGAEMFDLFESAGQLKDILHSIALVAAVQKHPSDVMNLGSRSPSARPLTTAT